MSLLVGWIPRVWLFFCTIPIPLLVFLLRFFFILPPNHFFQTFLVLLFFYSRGTLGVGGSGMPHGASGICQCHRDRRRMSCFHGRVFLQVGAHLLFTAFVTAGSFGGILALDTRMSLPIGIQKASTVASGMQRLSWSWSVRLGVWCCLAGGRGCLGFRSVEQRARAVCPL